MEWITHFLSFLPSSSAFMLVLIVLLICGLGLPLPEEFPLIFTGYLVSQGDITFPDAILGTMAAVIVGDSILFFLGRKYGKKLLDKPWAQKIISPKTLQKVELMMKKYGQYVSFFARFMAGLRGIVFFTCGMFRFSYIRFLLMDLVAALLSVPLIIWLAYRGFTYANSINDIQKSIKKTGWISLVFALVLFVSIYFFMKSKRGRKYAKIINLRKMRITKPD